MLKKKKEEERKTMKQLLCLGLNHPSYRMLPLLRCVNSGCSGMPPMQHLVGTPTLRWYGDDLASVVLSSSYYYGRSG
jgi:hypothetical protein